MSLGEHGKKGGGKGRMTRKAFSLFGPLLHHCILRPARHQGQVLLSAARDGEEAASSRNMAMVLGIAKRWWREEKGTSSR
jgi:hypothetical protein